MAADALKGMTHPTRMTVISKKHLKDFPGGDLLHHVLRFFAGHLSAQL